MRSKGWASWLIPRDFLAAGTLCPPVTPLSWGLYKAKREKNSGTGRYIAVRAILVSKWPRCVTGALSWVIKTRLQRAGGKVYAIAVPVIRQIGWHCSTTLPVLLSGKYGIDFDGPFDPQRTLHPFGADAFRVWAVRRLAVAQAVHPASVPGPSLYNFPRALVLFALTDARCPRSCPNCPCG